MRKNKTQRDIEYVPVSVATKKLAKQLGKKYNVNTKELLRMALVAYADILNKSKFAEGQIKHDLLYADCNDFLEKDDLTV